MHSVVCGNRMSAALLRTGYFVNKCVPPVEDVLKPSFPIQYLAIWLAILIRLPKAAALMSCSRRMITDWPYIKSMKANHQFDQQASNPFESLNFWPNFALESVINGDFSASHWSASIKLQAVLKVVSLLNWSKTIATMARSLQPLGSRNLRPF